MYRRIQSDMRENPASIRRHGSRQATESTENENSLTKENQLLELSSPGHGHPLNSADCYPHAASPRAVTGGNTETPPSTSGGTRSVFEPLIGSLEAARLLGNIHVKTLQRYARHGRVPGHQIGGHWYFRASELDAWLRLQINSKSQFVR
jgi:excisionase family DNA binding protein